MKSFNLRIIATSILMAIVFGVNPDTTLSLDDCPQPCTMMPITCDGCTTNFHQTCYQWTLTISCEDGTSGVWTNPGQWASGGNTICGVTPCTAIAP